MHEKSDATGTVSLGTNLLKEIHQLRQGISSYNIIQNFKIIINLIKNNVEQMR